MFLRSKLISARKIISALLAISLSFGLFGCENIKLTRLFKDFSASGIQNVGFDSSRVNLAEVAPPITLVKLNQLLESARPKVSIINPLPQQILQNTYVEVDLELKDYSLFKDEDLKLGPHLSLILDNEPYQDIHDLSKPIVLENLKPGTHQLSVLIEKPWGESFKNPEALAQTTFSILTETEADLNPPPLVYNQPNGSYQAEPVLLDFYVTGIKTNTWQVRVNINGEKFLLEQMEPIYLEGFQKGNNLIQLELLDREGKVVGGKSNQPIRLINYEPEQSKLNTQSELNTLAKLVSGQISFGDSVVIVDQNYRSDNVSQTDLVQEDSLEVLEDDDSENLEQNLSVEETDKQAVFSPTGLSPEEEMVSKQKSRLEDEDLSSLGSTINNTDTKHNAVDAKGLEDSQRLLSSPDKVNLDQPEESKTFDALRGDESEHTDNKKIRDNPLTNFELSNFSPKINQDLSQKNDLGQALTSKNSVPTNVVSEKIRVLIENPPKSSAEISPLPNSD